MKSYRRFLFSVLWLVVVAAGATARGEVTNELFADLIVRQFKIHVAEPEFQKLKRDNHTYVSATVAVGDQVYSNVAVRLKGRGSFRPLDDKPSLAVKFDQFVPGQKLFGLSKIMLNNSVQDSSLLSEYVATSLFRDAGVPAARVTHARVMLNGRDLGFYVLIEAMNKTFLRQHFKNANGNLYEGYAKDIDQTLEHDSGPPSDQSDLRALVTAARLPVQDRVLRLPQLLDVDRCRSFLAMTMLIAQHDSYPINRNNYRIYHEPNSDKFVMIPHGIDGSFTENNLSIRPPTKYLLARAILDDPSGRMLYRERIASLFTNVFKLDSISNRIQSAAERLEAAAISPAESAKIGERATNFLRRVTLRHERVLKELGQPDRLRLIVDPVSGVNLTGWEPDIDVGQATLEKRAFEQHPTLYVRTGAQASLGVWRTRALLDPGSYQMTARVRTVKTGVQDGAGGTSGAGIRAFKLYTTQKRAFGEDEVWTSASHHFRVLAGEEEVEFICDLKGRNAEAWFDLDSIKVFKQ